MDIRKLTPPPSPSSFPRCFLFLPSDLWGAATLLALALTLLKEAGFLLTPDLACIYYTQVRMFLKLSQIWRNLGGFAHLVPSRANLPQNWTLISELCSHWSEAPAGIKLKGVTEPLFQDGAEVWATESSHVDEDAASQCIPRPSLHSSVGQRGAGGLCPASYPEINSSPLALRTLPDSCTSMVGRARKEIDKNFKVLIESYPM